MPYFIPAHYQKASPMGPNLPPWEWIQQGLSFDDAGSQMRIFEQEGVPVTAVILNYAPHLRIALREKGLFHTSILSLFDRMQGVDERPMQRIRPEDLQWPQGAHFLYQSFFLDVEVGEEHYARVSFAQDGAIHSLVRYEEGKPHERLYLDDRGFFSAREALDGEKRGEIEFYSPSGDLRFRLEGWAGALEVLPAGMSAFRQTHYQTLSDALVEQLEAYREQVIHEKPLIVSCDPRHNDMILRAFSPEQIVMTLFGDRAAEVTPEDWLALSKVPLFVVDTPAQEEQLSQIWESLPEKSEKPQITVLSPFDTRMQLGKSQRIAALRLVILLDGLSQETLEAMFPILQNLVLAKKEVELDWICFQGESPLRDRLKAWMDPWNAFFEQQRIQEAEAADPTLEGLIPPLPPEQLRLRYTWIRTEKQLMDRLQYARLFLDLSQSPNVYTQIMCISAGIAQIVRTEKSRVAHQKNGYVISDLAELGTAIDYFLEGLKHWNQALVENFRILRENTGDALVRRWKPLLKEK